MKQTQHPEKWGLQVSTNGELLIQGNKVTDLAAIYGTPLHIINLPRLKQTAENFRATMNSVFAGNASVHYPFKCNSVPAIVQAVMEAGLKAEVMTEYELDLAVKVGFQSHEIIVNGPCKTEQFLIKCVEQRVNLVVIDSLDELAILQRIADSKNRDVSVLLRINPDYKAKGINSGAATGSRTGCAFGLDLKSGEPFTALEILKQQQHIRFEGFHFHIGTGIRNPKDYFNTLKKLFPLFKFALSQGFEIRYVDVGGGFASFTTRELTTKELILSQGFNYFPSFLKNHRIASFLDFGQEIKEALGKFFTYKNMPHIVFEPGRCITSPNQFLVLKVHYIKKRPGVTKWIITDGGLGTVSMPTYYEYHEVFLCNDVNRLITERATIIGPCCFAADVVYRNKPLPKVTVGEVIAIMDSGAYFTALESSFGFPRPAIIAVDRTEHQIARERESFAEMISRDKIITNTLKEVLK